MDAEVTQVAPEKDKGGTWVTIGSQAYKVPPLNFAAIKAFQDGIANLGAASASGVPTSSQMDVIIDVVHASFRRNYTEMTREDIADMIDLSNYQEVLGAVLNISGFKPAEASSGEAPASTGTAPTSP